ncbi:hypothetical protein Q8A73_024481 [Channa argus]|nr:hypothetical protein Q8A73_024481 [Channa argus]
MEENFRGSSRAAEPRQGVPRAGWARATWAPGGSWRKISGGHPGLRSPGRGCLGRVGRGPRGPLEGHGGRFQGVIPGCGAQAGGASGGSGEGPGGPWRVMEDDFRGSSRAAEPRQGVPRAGRAGAPGAPGGSWRTISGGHAGTPRPARGCLGRVGRGPRGPLEGHGGRFQGVMRGRPGPPGGASGGSGEGHGGVLEVSVSARVPGARACLGWSTRGTSLPLPEYQDHESAFAGVPGPRDRRRVKHHLTDRLAHQTRHRRAPAGRPSAGVRAGGSSGPRVGLYVREGPAQGVRESPRLPPRVPPGPTDRKRDRDAPSAPAVLPRSPWRGRGSPAARCQGRPSAARRGPSGKHSVSRTLGSVAPTPQTSLGGRSALPSGVRPPSAQSQARRVRPGSPPLSGGLPG